MAILPHPNVPVVDQSGRITREWLPVFNAFIKALTTGGGSGVDSDLLQGHDGAYYLARSHHTGTQVASTISDFSEAVDDRASALIQNGTGLAWTYSDVANTLTGNVSLASFSTTNLSEGSNLYYTDERVDDRVAALIQNGTGITWSYNDGAGTLTPTVTITQYTDEMAQDAAASLIQNGTGITWSYNDGSNTLTPTVTITQYTDELAQDAVGGALTDTSTIDFTYNDGANQITADVKDGSITYAKIQDVSATDKLLGRSSAGSGDVQEIACTAAGRALIDDADATAQRVTLGVLLATNSAADPTVNEDTGDGYGRGSIHVNTSPSSTSGRFWITHDTSAAAATWYGLGVYKATNVMFGIGCGASLTTGNHNVAIGESAGRQITSGANNTVVGDSAGKVIAATSENSCFGAQAGLANVLGNGHTFIGFSAGAAINSAGNDYNTFVGHSAGILATTAGSCTLIGRAAGRGVTTDGYVVAVGHAAMFYGGGTLNCTAVGNGAGGEAIDGSGLNYGLTNDTSVTVIGAASGKSSAAARSNCFALGYLAQIPVKDNTGVLGHGLTDVSTKGRMWAAFDPSVVTNNSGVTLTAANIVAGFLLRSGSPGAGISDTLPTAADIVAGGPGVGCEANISRQYFYQNTTSQTITILAGTGVTLSGTHTVAAGVTAIFNITVTVSTSGSEAVTHRRLNA